jgi:two-component system, NarL family, sensor kinase
MLNQSEKLKTLKTIAETLNESQNKHEMLQTVLDQLIAITHFEAGWIFIEDGDLELAADCGLPEALSVHDKKPMCSQDCYCMSKYRAGTLTKATNIIECKRLVLAINEGIYHTNGLTHHATVPLLTPEKSYGLLNVAAAERTEYDQEELDLLESIAYQMGTALRRIEQYEREEQRVRLLEELNQFVHCLRRTRGIDSFMKTVVQQLMHIFSLDFIQITVGQHESQLGHKQLETMEYIPLNEVKGELIYSIKKALTDVEEEVLKLAINHIEFTYRDILLQEKETNMARMEERSRLAQDLHDSVCQLLYSIVLTSKAAKAISSREARGPIEDIFELSSQALQEMRSLIAGQKPTGLEKGLLTGLVEYAEKLQLNPNIHAEGSTSIPYAIEETLYRIGQEAIHNAKKHAKTNEIHLTLKRNANGFTLLIQDNGIGFDQEKMKESFGLNGMRERASVYGGSVRVKSIRKEGTTIHVFVPLKGEIK